MASADVKTDVKQELKDLVTIIKSMRSVFKT